MNTKEIVIENLGLNLEEVQDILSAESLNTMSMLAIRGGGDDEPEGFDLDSRTDKCDKCDNCQKCDKCRC